MADTATSTVSNGWLDKILNAGASLGGSYLTADATKAAADKTAKANTAQANAAQANSSSMTKILIIGGAVVALIAVVGLVIFGSRK